MRIFESIDLRHLRALAMMMSERSITKAADRLAVTQPAISNSLARLREHYGDELLLRQGSRLVLTPFAERLQPALHSLLMDAQAITSARPHFDPAEAEHSFSLLAPDHLAAIFLPDVVREIAACSPRSRVMCLAPNATSRQMLVNGDLDLTVQPLSQLLPDHPHHLLFAEPLVYIARQDHPVARAGISEEDIAALPQARAFLPRSDNAAPPEPAAMAQMSAALIPSVVAGSDLVARVPRSLADFYRQRSCVPLECFPCSAPATMIHMQWPSRKDNDPASMWFREKFVDVVKRQNMF